MTCPLGHFVVTVSQWSSIAHLGMAQIVKEGTDSLRAAAVWKLVALGMLFQKKVMLNSDGIYFALSRRTGH